MPELIELRNTIKLNSGTARSTGSVVTTDVISVQMSPVIGPSVYRTAYTASIDYAKLSILHISCAQEVTVYLNGTDEIQSIGSTGTVSGGTFTASFGGNTTTAIAYNATATTVQNALAALASVGTGNITCAGGPLPGTAVTVTFKGTLGLSNVAQLTLDSGLITGGGSMTIATSTAGVAPDKTWVVLAGQPVQWATGSIHTNPITANVTKISITNANSSSAQVYITAGQTF